jgi:hypothetical protein
VPVPFSEGKVRRRFTRSKAASDWARASASINSIYPNAIEICGSAAGTKGLWTFGALGLLILAVGFGITALDVPLRSNLSAAVLAFHSIMFAGAVILAVSGGVFLRLDLFSFRDEPVLFNRATRKVHVFRRRANWRRPFSPWPLVIDTYDWDSIHAEVKGGPVYNGALVVFRYWMYLTVTDRPGSKTVIDRFVVGSHETAAGDHAPHWEHIRRYMEEGGPPIYADDEFCSLHKFSHRSAWGQGIFFLHPEFKRWCRQSPVLMSFVTVVTVIALPFFVVFAFCIWLAHFTSRDPYWPQAIVQAAGGAPLPEATARAQAPESPRALERKAEAAQIEAERAEIGAKPLLTVAAPTRRAVWVTLAIVGAMVAAKLGIEWWRR